MSEEELIEIIKENLNDMKSSIEMKKCFEINSEQAKEFYFAIATVLTLKEKQQKELQLSREWQEFFKKEYIDNGKIKKELKELEKHIDNYIEVYNNFYKKYIKGETEDE